MNKTQPSDIETILNKIWDEEAKDTLLIYQPKNTSTKLSLYTYTSLLSLYEYCGAGLIKPTITLSAKEYKNLRLQSAELLETQALEVYGIGHSFFGNDAIYFLGDCYVYAADNEIDLIRLSTAMGRAASLLNTYDLNEPDE